MQMSREAMKMMFTVILAILYQNNESTNIFLAGYPWDLFYHVKSNTKLVPLRIPHIVPQTTQVPPFQVLFWPEDPEEQTMPPAMGLFVYWQTEQDNYILLFQVQLTK